MAVAHDALPPRLGLETRACFARNLATSASTVWEVTKVGNDRAQLSNMAQQAREAGGHDALTVIADRGYFQGRRDPRLRQGRHDAARA